MTAATALATDLSTLPTHFPACTHTAAAGSPFDFMATDGTQHLSAKTTRKDGKICPQRIGQPSCVRFCGHFGLPADSTRAAIKEHITTSLPALLTKYAENTFDCPILYYNQQKRRIVLIRQVAPVDWGIQTLRLSRTGTAWRESSTLYLGATGRLAIGEFQVHTGRDCIKFRWNLEKLLAAFPDCFTITVIKE